MWKNTYKDYKPDTRYIQESVTTGKGIIGCEMNELYGWGEKHHITPSKPKKGIKLFLSLLFRKTR